MQTLASGVGDLKRVLTNVKSRGAWGEVQLARLLGDTMTIGPVRAQRKAGARQAMRSGRSSPSGCPGRADGGAPVWLPLGPPSFPRRNTNAWCDARASRRDAERRPRRRGRAGLSRAVEVQATPIASKYVAPPHTTDFAIMFLLFYRRACMPRCCGIPGLHRQAAGHLRVSRQGPTNLAALVNSLRD